MAACAPSPPPAHPAVGAALDTCLAHAQVTADISVLPTAPPRRDLAAEQRVGSAAAADALLEALLALLRRSGSWSYGSTLLSLVAVWSTLVREFAHDFALSTTGPGLQASLAVGLAAGRAPSHPTLRSARALVRWTADQFLAPTASVTAPSAHPNASIAGDPDASGPVAATGRRGPALLGFERLLKHFGGEMRVLASPLDPLGAVLPRTLDTLLAGTPCPVADRPVGSHPAHPGRSAPRELVASHLHTSGVLAEHIQRLRQAWPGAGSQALLAAGLWPALWPSTAPSPAPPGRPKPGRGARDL